MHLETGNKDMDESKTQIPIVHGNVEGAPASDIERFIKCEIKEEINDEENNK